MSDTGNRQENGPHWYQMCDNPTDCLAWGVGVGWGGGGGGGSDSAPGQTDNIVLLYVVFLQFGALQI